MDRLVSTIGYADSFMGGVEARLVDLGLATRYVEPVKITVVVLLLTTICFVADFIAKRLLLSVIDRVVKKTKTDLDDIFLEKKVFHNLAHLVPPLLLESLIPSFFLGYDKWIAFGVRFSDVYLIVVGMTIMLSLGKVLQVVLGRQSFMKDKPTESYIQLLNITIYVLGGIYLTAVLFGKSPWGVFSALGAMSVVLMLVFKDTILGFVASIQLAANDMVKVGDWVEFPKYGADGDVIEIKLQTIKIRNWDKTITTVPTYAFVSDAFKNWRGMEESGGRRIKRSIFIDMSTIKLCDEEMLNRYDKVNFIADYLNDKQAEVASFNSSKSFDLSNLVNGRRITNMGTFRAYVAAYLKQNEFINKDMTFLVRQLQPTEKGLPLEIYVFSSEKSWALYEGIQADIFDHILSVIKEFDLSIFQSPSGNDFKSLMK